MFRDYKTMTKDNIVHNTELWKCLDIKIVNGKFGFDQGVGEFTRQSAAGKSVAEYVQKYTEKHLDMMLFLGAVYILHDGSIHRHDEIYDNVANDTVTMKCKCDVPIPVIGDVNSRAGMMGDFIYIDDVDARKTNDDI